MARKKRIRIVQWEWVLLFVLTCVKPLHSLCRDSWLGYMPLPDYRRLTASKCYVQLFFNGKPLVMMWPPSPPFLLYPKDVNDTAAYDPAEDGEAICQRTLTMEDCARWQECRMQAEFCCKAATPSSNVSSCPATWDGVSCWGEAVAGETTQQHCPKYYRGSHQIANDAVSTRRCTENGSWETSEYLIEKTNYTQCFDTEITKQILRASVVVELVGHVISLLALVFVLILVCSTSSVRHEVLSRECTKLHVNLFCTMLLLSVGNLAFLPVYWDAFMDIKGGVYMENPVWCRLLYGLLTYARTASYMAMLAEGLFLYRRIKKLTMVNVAESLASYYALTWGMPVLTTSAFAVTRVLLHNNERCWIAEGFSQFDLIHMVPNLIALASNACFLAGIELRLVTTLQGGKSSNTRQHALRHAVRSSMSLIPIFGLQFMFIIYRPTARPAYEIFSAVLTSTQGALVAILFCLTTKEIRSILASCMCNCKTDTVGGKARNRRDSNNAENRRQRYMKILRRYTRTSASSLSPSGKNSVTQLSPLKFQSPVTEHTTDEAHSPTVPLRLV